MANPISALFAWFLRKAARIVKLDERLGSLEGKIETFGGKIDALEGRMDSLEGRIDILEKRIDLLPTKSELSSELDRKLAPLAAEIGILGARFDEAVKVHERLAALETALALRRPP